MLKVNKDKIVFKGLLGKQVIDGDATKILLAILGLAEKAKDMRKVVYLYDNQLVSPSMLFVGVLEDTNNKRVVILFTNNSRMSIVEIDLGRR